MNEQVKAVLDNYLAVITSIEGVSQIYLFGSYANGTPHERSDIDLMILIDDNLETVKTTLAVNTALAGKRVIPLDVLVNKLSDFNGALGQPTLQQHIKDEGVLLYAK